MGSWTEKPSRRETWRERVDLAVKNGDVRWRVGGTCGAPKRRHNTPGAEHGVVEWCRLPAGQGTAHLGVGRCAQHGGNSKRENAMGAWAMAHELARALNVTPWEALLGEVRRTAGAVAFLDRKVAEAPSDDALLQTTDPETGRPGYARWVKLRMEERQHLARVAKMAVDAGVAQELVARFELQGEHFARALTAVLGGLGLSDEQEELATRLMRAQLLQLEAGATEDRVVEAEVVEMDERRKR